MADLRRRAAGTVLPVAAVASVVLIAVGAAAVAASLPDREQQLVAPGPLQRVPAAAEKATTLPAAEDRQP